MRNLKEISDVVASCAYPGIRISLGGTGWNSSHPWLQIEAEVVDRATGETRTMHGRKWLLSVHMTKSEVVQTAFLAVKTWLEHEAREAFTFEGCAVFSPHLSVDAISGLVHLRAFDERP